MVSTTTIPYDYLVFAVGAEVQTFNIPGVREHSCFMKELEDAEKMQRRFMDCTCANHVYRIWPIKFEPRHGVGGVPWSVFGGAEAVVAHGTSVVIAVCFALTLFSRLSSVVARLVSSSGMSTEIISNM